MTITLHPTRELKKRLDSPSFLHDLANVVVELGKYARDYNVGLCLPATSGLSTDFSKIVYFPDIEDPALLLKKTDPDSLVTRILLPYKPELRHLWKLNLLWPHQTRHLGGAHGFFKVGDSEYTAPWLHLTNNQATLCAQQLLYGTVAALLQNGDLGQLTLTVEDFLKFPKRRIIARTEFRYHRQSLPVTLDGTAEIVSARFGRGMRIIKSKLALNEGSVDGEIALVI